MNFSSFGRVASLLALVAIFGFGLQSVSLAMANVPGGNASRVIAPGDTHSNGDVTVANSAGSHGNATETPWQGAENSDATEVHCGQQFQGSVDSIEGNDSVELGSRSGSEASPVSITGGGGTITMRSDTWASVSNTGSGTITAKNTSGVTIGTWGPGQSSTIHNP